MKEEDNIKQYTKLLGLTKSTKPEKKAPLFRVFQKHRATMPRLIRELELLLRKLKEINRECIYCESKLIPFKLQPCSMDHNGKVIDTEVIFICKNKKCKEYSDW